jgi:transcriptional regulator with XRE-family HTH domain
MTTKKTKIEHADIVRRFAERLKEKRLALGLTQAELAKRSDVTLNYIGRLEAAGAAPGIDLLERLALALGTTAADLIPSEPPPDPADVLRKEARRLFEALVKFADRDTLLLLVPLLARLSDHPVGER